MHIMEGYLPLTWCIIWFVISFIIVAFGIYQIKKIVDETPESKALLAVSGAFMFILSSLKLPSVTGSCSHPCGNGLGAALFGPAVTAVLATIVLLFQALLLAHGGLTTLGANIVSMGIVGPLVAWAVYKGLTKANISSTIAIKDIICSFRGPFVNRSHLIALSNLLLIYFNIGQQHQQHLCCSMVLYISTIFLLQLYQEAQLQCYRYQQSAPRNHTLFQSQGSCHHP